MSDLRTKLNEFTQRVRQLQEHVVGNEQATKQSLIAPLFTILGYDITDPRECLPEYKVDFGRDRSTKPIDWAFKVNGKFAFFVEAKEVGKKLNPYAEQLADYFAKEPLVKLGILTNGVQWRFFTDAEHTNIMDREPFVKWDVLTDGSAPLELLAIIQKNQFKPELLGTLAHRKRTHNLLINELNRLLEPSNEFVRLAIANIETRKINDAVVDSWKPLLTSAIYEWSRQNTLKVALAEPSASTPLPIDPPAPISKQQKEIITTPDEIRFFETVKTLLGSSRPVTYTDHASYFKIHMPEETPSIRMRKKVVCRLYSELKQPSVRIPIPIDKIERLLSVYPKVTFPEPNWISITLNSFADVPSLGEILRITYDYQNSVDDETNDDTESTSVLKMA